jgi:hypothetical protein
MSLLSAHLKFKPTYGDALGGLDNPLTKYTSGGSTFTESDIQNSKIDSMKASSIASMGYDSSLVTRRNRMTGKTQTNTLTAVLAGPTNGNLLSQTSVGKLPASSTDISYLFSRSVQSNQMPTKNYGRSDEDKNYTTDWVQSMYEKNQKIVMDLHSPVNPDVTSNLSLSSFSK